MAGLRGQAAAPAKRAAGPLRHDRTPVIPSLPDRAAAVPSEGMRTFKERRAGGCAFLGADTRNV
jgi:hypothetical protein